MISKKQYTSSGYLIVEESYVNDVLDGPTKRYNRKGRVIKTLNYKNGELIKQGQ